MTKTETVKFMGDKIAVIRKAAGLSQEAFGRQLGVSRSAFQHYERNEHDVPSSVLRNICDQFDIDPWWLLFEDGEARISGRSHDVIEVVRFLDNFIDTRARRLSKSLTEQKKWDVIHFMAADFLNASHDLEGIPPQLEEKIDNIIQLVAA